MGKCIVKIEDLYCEWSTVVDAPTTKLMAKADFISYIGNEYGRQGLLDIDDRLYRADITGTSSLVRTKESLLLVNRAGKDETHLNEEQLYLIFN